MGEGIGERFGGGGGLVVVVGGWVWVERGEYRKAL